MICVKTEIKKGNKKDSKKTERGTERGICKENSSWKCVFKKKSFFSRPKCTMWKCGRYTAKTIIGESVSCNKEKGELYILSCSGQWPIHNGISINKSEGKQEDRSLNISCSSSVHFIDFDAEKIILLQTLILYKMNLSQCPLSLYRHAPTLLCHKALIIHCGL